MHYFNYATGLTMCNNHAWEKLFAFAPAQESALASPMDLALAIQQLTEDIVFWLAATARELTGCEPRDGRRCGAQQRCKREAP